MEDQGKTELKSLKCTVSLCLEHGLCNAMGLEKRESANRPPGQELNQDTHYEGRILDFQSYLTLDWDPCMPAEHLKSHIQQADGWT